MDNSRPLKPSTRALREAAALETLERDTPIRARFHAWLLEQGFREHATPKPGDSYQGSHVQLLWEAYLHATLAERSSQP